MMITVIIMTMTMIIMTMTMITVMITMITVMITVEALRDDKMTLAWLYYGLKLGAKWTMDKLDIDPTFYSGMKNLALQEVM